MNWLFGWALSYRLWRALWGRIPAHPLLSIVKPERESSSDFGCSPIFITILLIMTLPALWVVGFGFALMAIAIGGTLRGMAAAALTARGVYGERGIGRLPLLGLTPGGVLGSGWVLALREFRMSRGGRFVNRYVQNAQRIIGFGGLAMVGLITFGTLIFQFEGVTDFSGETVRPAMEYVLGAVQIVAIAGAWLISDNVQSPLIGVLIGIWTGANARRRPEAAGVAAALYLALQMTLLTAALFAWTSEFGLMNGPRFAVIVAALIVARELILRAMWSRLRRHLNASGRELMIVLSQ